MLLPSDPLSPFQSVVVIKCTHTHTTITKLQFPTWHVVEGACKLSWSNQSSATLLNPHLSLMKWRQAHWGLPLWSSLIFLMRLQEYSTASAQEGKFLLVPVGFRINESRLWQCAPAMLSLHARLACVCIRARGKRLSFLVKELSNFCPPKESWRDLSWLYSNTAKPRRTKWHD